MQGGEEFLKLGPAGKVARTDALRGGEFPELGELVGIGFFVDAINGGLFAVLDYRWLRVRWPGA
jgi:hypothetical protein